MEPLWVIKIKYEVCRVFNVIYSIICCSLIDNGTRHIVRCYGNCEKLVIIYFAVLFFFPGEVAKVRL